MKKVIIALIILVLSACSTTQVTPTRVDTTALLSPVPTKNFLYVTNWPDPEPSITKTVLSTGTPNPTATEIPLAATLGPTQTATPSLQAGQSITLTSLHMVNANIGWGTDLGGHVVRTTDGGHTWQDVTPPQSGIFTSLDATHAWATLKISDSCDASRMNWSEYKVCMPGPDVVIWRTNDGGQTWQAGEPFKAEDFHYKPVAIQFTDASMGWFLYVSSFGPMGYTTMGMARTEDGGISWVLARAPGSVCIYQVMTFANAHGGWSGEDCRFNQALDWTPLKNFIKGKVTPELSPVAPVLYQTSDGAKSSWDSVTLPSPQVFPAELTAPNADPNLLILCGTTSMERISPEAFTLRWTCSGKYGASPLADFSYQYLTLDGGQTWRSWPATGDESFVNASAGWRLYSPGKGQISQLQQTTDGGYTWATIKSVSWQNAQFNFISEQVGWAVVINGYASALVHTTDSGQTWEELKSVIAP